VEHVRDPPVVAEAPIFLESLFDVSRARFEVADDVGRAGQATSGAHAQLGRYVRAAIEEFGEQPRALGRTRRDPVLLQSDCESHRRFNFICSEQPVERRADVCLLGRDKLVTRPATRGDCLHRQVGGFGEREERVCMAAPDRVGLAATVEPLDCELTDGLQHPEPVAFAHADEALVDE
jgi:hypothetical protein